MGLNSLESYLTDNAHLTPSSPNLFLHLFNSDIIPEEAFLTWADSDVIDDVAGDVTVTTGVTCRECCSQFIAWLNEAEEESGEESD